MNKKAIPVIFAVTGHIDISSNAIENIKKRVKEIFYSFKKDYPNTPAVLISALAEGADMLVAELALECGIELHAILPFDEKEYIKSFKDSNSIQKFNYLKSKAAKIETLTNFDISNANEAYEILAKKLADISTILIALWDGKDSGKKGGTFEVINFKKNLFSIQEKNKHIGSAIYIITTPRKNDIYSEEIIKLKKEYIGSHMNEKEFKNMLKKIDSLNSELIKTDNKKDTYLQFIMKFFEKKASVNQKKFKLYSKLILLISAFSIISLEFFHDFGVDLSLMLYGIGIIVVFLIYYIFVNKKNIQSNFVYSRGFVEAIRVQNIWNSLNIKENVSDYYLLNQHHKYLWIRISLRNIAYIDKKPFNPTNKDKIFIPEYWIDEQITYYKKAIRDRTKKYSFWEKLEKFFYISGLIFLIIMFGYYFLEKFLEFHHHLLHLFIFLSGVSFLLAVLIGEQYNQIEGFENEIYNFEVMYDLFINTKYALKNFEKNTNQYKKIIFELGVAALDENTKWVVLHDNHKVKPILE